MGNVKCLQCAAHAVLVFSGVLLVAGCASTRIGELKVGEEMVVGRTTFSADMHDDEYSIFNDYRVAPGDVLDVLYQVRSWVQEVEFHLAIDNVISVKFVNHPELNETQMIRPDGRISLPYIGSAVVVGMTVDDLQSLLRERFSAHINDPELYVVVDEFRGAINEFKRDLHTAPRGLSRLVTVRPDGHATFAMVGDVQVTGRTVPEVGEELNARYHSIMPGLSVDLFLEKHEGSRVFVFGEVRQPGAYQILRPTSIFEAISLAGSISSGARIDSVLVLRQRESTVVATRINLREAMDPVRADGQGKGALPVAKGGLFYLRPNDVVFVPRRRLSTVAEISREVSDILFFRGWGFNLYPDGRSRQ